MMNKVHIIIFLSLLSVFCPVKAEEKSWHGSLMFSVTDNRRIHELLKNNEEKKERTAAKVPRKEEVTEKFMQNINIKSGDIKDLPTEAPAFYLNSILYIAKDDWTIWINGKKISARDVQDFVQVIGVTKNKVILAWESEYFGYINEGWDSVSSDNIKVDKGNNRVYFTLYPNQTFVTKTMKIVEGKRSATPMVYEKIKVTGKKSS